MTFDMYQKNLIEKKKRRRRDVFNFEKIKSRKI